jgi:hypothetical protein
MNDFQFPEEFSEDFQFPEDLLQEPPTMPSVFQSVSEIFPDKFPNLLKINEYIHLYLNSIHEFYLKISNYTNDEIHELLFRLVSSSYKTCNSFVIVCLRCNTKSTETRKIIDDDTVHTLDVSQILLKYCNNNCERAISVAVENNRIKLVELFIKNGTSVVFNKNGLLRIAVRNKNYPMIKLLLRNGAHKEPSFSENEVFLVDIINTHLLVEFFTKYRINTKLK